MGEVKMNATLTTPAETARRKFALSRQSRAVLSTLLYMAPALIIFALFSYRPFIHSLWLSLNITDAKGAAVKFNGLNYFVKILTSEDYLRSLLITAKFALMVVPLGIVAGVALALLAGIRLKGIKVFRTIFTSSIAVSLASGALIWAMIYSPTVGLTNWLVDALQLKSPGLLANATTALGAVALMTIWSGLGFNFIFALAGIQAIPQDVYESGAIDGATGWSAFWNITLPLLAPSLLFLLVVNTIGACQAFTQFNVLMQGAGPEGSTQVFVYSAFKSFWLENRYGFSSAMSIVLFVVLFVLSFVQFRVLDERVHYQ
jgi:sn-glycerol 3-phosphate transport system permease protein